jgi:tRNA-Thr(GGU) m(6)t(6)A37 methyltransferase TsaA
VQYNLRSIGIVVNGFKQPGLLDTRDSVSDLIIAPRNSRALDGIESFSHIIVIFWLHKIRTIQRSMVKVHPRKDISLPLTGIFATRSPVRSNPIGITVVKLIKRESNILTVTGLDAIDGTPVLDIKPYIPEEFSESEIRVPAWLEKVYLPAT